MTTPQDDLRMLMRDRGITQKELSRLSDVSESMISLWMNERQNLTIDRLQAIAKALDSQVRIIKQ